MVANVDEEIRSQCKKQYRRPATPHTHSNFFLLWYWPGMVAYQTLLGFGVVIPDKEIDHLLELKVRNEIMIELYKINK